MYTQKYPHICSPIQLGNVTLRNRIFSTPTSAPQIGSEGYLTKDNIAYYEIRAKGGAAAVTIAEAIVHAKTGRARRNKIAIEDPWCISSLSDAARAIRQHGAIPSLELSHYGLYAHVANLEDPIPDGYLRFAPSDRLLPNGTIIPAMPVEMIEEIVQAYGTAAARAKEAGFEMVTVHGGHGWLLNQFMSEATNHRTDQFGGSFENRMRFTLMVLESVRAAVGPGFPIEIRISGAEFSPNGYTIEEGVEIAKALDGKVDLIHVSAGHHEYPDTFNITHPSMFLDHGCNVSLAARIKQAVKTPVACVGGISDLDQIEQIIASGQADIVEIGRGLLADPELPLKAHYGQPEKVIKCIRCFHCMSSLPTGKTISCTVNPILGRELENMRPLPPARPRRVLVAGGGPGGLMAAVTAARRGHKVILCEKDDRLGGLLNCERYVPFKHDLYYFTTRLAEQLKELSVDVRLNTTVTPELVQEIAPDALISAIGANAIVPPIPGINDPRVRFASSLTEENPGFGHRVVILGGGLVGSETAVHLLSQGHDVTVVEAREDYAIDANRFHKVGLRLEFEKGIKVLTSTRGVGINEVGLICVGPDNNEQVLEADTILCVVGFRSPRAEVDALRPLAPWFRAIGDCIKPGRVADAVAAGYYAALDI